MKQGLIGVIVPVYKVEKYIAECIESILVQTYTNLRLILVDDGTPDDAGKTCDEYAKKDTRITVIHQENAGVTRARARGVEEADDCEFITFVDGDDTLVNNGLEKMYKHMDDCTEIVMCNNYHANEANVRFYELPDGQDSIETTYFIKRNIALNGGAPWGKLFRRTLFNKKTFDIPRDIICGEDVIMNIRLAFNCNSPIKLINEPLYNYRIHPQSVFNQFRHTAEYEHLFWRKVLEAIPTERIPEFINDHINIRLTLWKMHNKKAKRPQWADTPFHIQLKSDIKEYHFTAPFFDKLLLFNTNTIIRAMIIILRTISKPFLRMSKNQLSI